MISIQLAKSLQEKLKYFSSVLPLQPLQRCQILGTSHWQLEVISSLPLRSLLVLRVLPGPALVPAVGAEVSPSTTAPPTAARTKK